MIRDKFVVLVLVMSMIFTGCSRVMTPDELIGPPELDIEKKEVKDAITKFLPQNSEIFTFPYAKENRESSFVLEDITGNGREEIIAIYRDKSTFKVGLLMLTNELGIWSKESDITLDGDDITDYRMVDLDGDKTLEIILGYEARNTSVRKLDIFSGTDDGLNLVFETHYYALSIDDILGNGKNQLIVTSVASENTDNRVAVYSVEEESVVMKNSMRYPNGTEPYNVTVGNVIEGKKGIFVDLYVNNSYGRCDVLVYNKDLLVSLIGKDGEGEVVTYQQNPIQSRDVDNNGTIEIGSTSISPMINFSIEKYEFRSAFLMPIRNYFRYTGEDFVKVKEYFDETTLGITFDIPSQMWDSYFTTLEYSDGDYVLNFYFKFDNSNNTDEVYKFLEFRLAPKEEKESFEGYQVIYETKDNVVVGRQIENISKLNNAKYTGIIEATSSFSTLISQFTFN